MKREVIRVATFAEHTNNQEKVIGIFFVVKNDRIVRIDDKNVRNENGV